MKALVTVCRDPLRPAHRRTTRTVGRRRSLAALAPKSGPVICNVNGKWVSRKAWNRRVRDGDSILFVQLPQDGGGGGSDPMRAVLMIAVMVAAPWVAGQLLGTTFGAYAATALGSTQAFMSVATAVVGMAGSMLVNALIPPPRPPQAQQMSSAGGLASPSPTYSLGAQGNAARLGQPIPAIYGRHIVYPDFAAAPYVEYAGNEQYLYQLFCLGQGSYDIEAVRIEDTPISSFAEITYEVVPPGGTVSLFPTRVITSTEVAGQEALTAATLGPFVASSAGTAANALAVDVVMSRGLYYANDNGGLDSLSIAWTVEAQKIDDNGAALGGWFVLGNETYSAATTTPQRLSRRYSVPEGRYQVRLTRTDAKQTESRYGHELLWAGLRAYLPGSQTYGDVTVVAMRLRATNNLSQQASRKVNFIVTRRLPTWHPTTGWSAPAPTRNPAWAFADVCKAAYGAGLADARIDLAGLYSLAQTWAARGDTFDGIFDTPGTVMEALQQIARAGRAIPYLQGGIAYCVRDSAETIPVGMFSQRNIVRGSLKLTYIMPSEETADCVDVTYFDSSVWAERTVRCQLPGGTAERPAKVKLFGVTTRQQAWQEGMHIAACNLYRRRMLSFATEMEGFIPTLGDLIAVQHDMPKWGQSGEVVAWDAATKEAILSEPLDWSAGGAHSFAFRRRDGSVCGPFPAVAGTDLYRVKIPSWNPATDPAPDTAGDRERSHFAFGPANEQYIRARVLAIRPRGTEQVEIDAVVESDYVHNADTGVAPGADAWQLPSRFTSPIVLGLTARSAPDDLDQMVLSWQPAAGAETYLIEQSNGDGTWVRIGEVSASNYSCRALYKSATVVRVAAVGLTRGPWATINYAGVADYMWVVGDDTQEMWSAGDDAQAMW